MSHLTTEQLNDLHQALTARYAEWNDPTLRPPSKGAVRLIIDVYEDWLDRLAVEPPEEEQDADGEMMTIAYGVGFERGRALGPREEFKLNISAANGHSVTHVAPPAPDVVEDCTELDDAWPTMPNLNGVDRFAEHGVSGAPDDDGPSDEPDAPADAVEKLAEVLSPAVAAALGPEHTVIAPPRESPAPDKPVGRERDPRVPDPDVARERLATALAQGSNGNARPVLRVPYPEPEPVDVARINQPRTLSDADGEQRRAKRSVTETRMRQLDELKTKRRLDADRKDRERRAATAADVTYAQMVAEIKRISMGGAMPTQNQFNMSKPAPWPTANGLTMKFHTTWEALATECGLEWSRGRKNVPSAA